MAIESQTTGYVGLGFSNTGNTMFGSDVVLGWIANGQPVVNTWNIPQGDYYYIQAGNAASPAWTITKAVWQGKRASDGAQVTVVCFSRNLTAPSASSSAVISSPSLSALKMVYAAQASSDGSPSFGSPHSNKGGLMINLLSGSSYEIEIESNKKWVIIHGALMAAAWAFLFPLGILLARHQWVLGHAKLKGVHGWFHLHRAVQCIGLVVFILGIALAWRYLDIDDFKGGDKTLYSCAQTHEILGTIVAGMVVLQILLGFIRPHPGPGKIRQAWTLAHHWLGRLVIVSAWTVVFLGIYMGHSSTAYKLDYSQWMIPVAVVIGFWLLLDVILSLTSLTLSRTQKASAPQEATTSTTSLDDIKLEMK